LIQEPFRAVQSFAVEQNLEESEIQTFRFANHLLEIVSCAMLVNLKGEFSTLHDHNHVDLELFRYSWGKRRAQSRLGHFREGEVKERKTR
jgi:hypothetical protein